MEILELVKKLGISTLITLHDMNLAAAYCQRLYALYEGRIAANGGAEEVLTPSLLRKVFHVDAVVQRHPATGRPHLAFLPLSEEAAR
jgi:iron complex transport system ATP-binding protein